MTSSNGTERRHAASEEPDQRAAFERDRDRIQYSSAFHRLSGITQIVRSGEEDVFHNRQQHSYKVEQIGRRLSQNLNDPNRNGGLLPTQPIEVEVVQGACLAHDLGHPPFGHAAEATLDRLVTRPGEFQCKPPAGHNMGDPDGFEGNAQTFRILTKLAVRLEDTPGLNLTRETLCATAKYPWTRARDKKGRLKKWSVYRTELPDFAFAFNALYDKAEEQAPKTLEAQVMDHSDDIAYSVHDLEDFMRCSIIPWKELETPKARLEIKNDVISRWHNAPDDASGLLDDVLAESLKPFSSWYEEVTAIPYTGRRSQRYIVREMTSRLIGRFLGGTSVNWSNRLLVLDSRIDAEIRIFKTIISRYVFQAPSLMGQQEGQSRMVEKVFRKIYSSFEVDDGGRLKPPSFIPHRLEYIWDVIKNDSVQPTDPIARFCADCICSMTENEMTLFHSRIFGRTAGSVLDPIIR